MQEIHNLDMVINTSNHSVKLDERVSLDVFHLVSACAKKPGNQTLLSLLKKCKLPAFGFITKSK